MIYFHTFFCEIAIKYIKLLLHRYKIYLIIIMVGAVGGGQCWEGWDADDGGGHCLMTLVGYGMMLGVVFVVVAV